MSSPRPVDDKSDTTNSDVSSDEEISLNSRGKMKGWAYQPYKIVTKDEEKFTIRLRKADKKETEWEHFEKIVTNATINTEDSAENDQQKNRKKMRTSRKSSRYVAEFLTYEDSDTDSDNSESSQQTATARKRKEITTRINSEHTVDQQANEVMPVPSEVTTAVQVDSTPAITLTTALVTNANTAAATMAATETSVETKQSITSTVDANVPVANNIPLQPAQATMANVTPEPINIVDKFIELQQLNLQWGILYPFYQTIALDNPDALFVVELFNMYVNAPVSFLKFSNIFLDMFSGLVPNVMNSFSPPSVPALQATTTPSRPTLTSEVVSRVSNPVMGSVVTSTPALVPVVPASTQASAQTSVLNPLPTPPTPVLAPLSPAVVPPVSASASSLSVAAPIAATAPQKEAASKAQPLASTSRMFGTHKIKPVESSYFYLASGDNDNNNHHHDNERTDFINDLLFDRDRSWSPSQR